MLIMVQKKNDEDQAHLFKDTYFESCSKHQLARAYHFEHKNHGLHVIYFKIFTNSFCVRVICINNIFYV